MTMKQEWIVFVQKPDNSMDFHAISTEEEGVTSEMVSNSFVQNYHDQLIEGSRVMAAPAETVYKHLTEGGFHQQVQEMKDEFNAPGVPFGEDDNPLEMETP